MERIHHLKPIELALRMKRLEKKGKLFLTPEGKKIVDKIAKVVK